MDVKIMIMHIFWSQRVSWNKSINKQMCCHKELLAERNNRINTIANNNMMEDFQEENVFHNADLLSELIFSEQAIESVEAANGSNRN